MKKIGLVGLGDMGIGLANNLLKNGFELTGYDLRDERLKELEKLGGTPAANCSEVAKNSDTIFIMVLNGQQVKDVVLGENELFGNLKSGSTIIVTATINPSEVKELETNRFTGKRRKIRSR
jgi:3-hydroxyisobutyrate dehydrogenase-like beta-hydroxyacid dehydrogenase